MTSDDDSLDPPEWVSQGAARATAPSSTTKPAPRAGTTSTTSAAPGEQPRPSPSRNGGPAPGPTERRRHRRRSLLVLAIVLLPVALVAVGVGWFLWELNPPGSPGPRVTIEISEGTGTGEIGEILAEEGVIGSSRAYDLYATITSAGPFDPGRYRFRESMGVRDATNVLKAGPEMATELSLTVAPGLTIPQMAEQVAKLPGRSAERFVEAAQSGAIRSRYQPAGVSSLEGLLQPDTYFIGEDETEADIVQRLVSTFDQRADALGLDTPNAAGLDPYQTIVAASLIEREAGIDEDRPLIAAVVRNRLAFGMRLQIDATVCYAKGGCPTALSNADLEVDSPYNTYRVNGLPPTPISAVTTRSLEAARNPADVPYLFYVLADENGRHAFATTGEEHERNVAAAEEKGLL